jgi:hypothetical protein
VVKSITVTMPHFLITVREDDQVVRTIDDCGFGREEGPNNLTPVIHDGSLSLDRRERCHLSVQHNNAPMPYSLFFEGEHDGCAFHWGSPFKQSHGCIHLTETDAKWLYEWAGHGAGAQPVALEITGPQPLPGVRIYRVGSANMLPRVILSINTRLAEEGFLARPPDSVYDEQTAEAVKDFQVDRDLEQRDGIVGPITADELSIAPIAPPCPD